MNITDIKKAWAEDSVIDSDDLFGESIRCGILHSKYLNIRTDHSLILKKLIIEYNQALSFYQNYYSGKYNHAEYEEMLKAKGLEFVKIKYMKTEIQKTIDADPAIVNILMKKAVTEEIVLYCDEVIKQIHSRQFAIKNAIDWRKFESGN